MNSGTKNNDTIFEYKLEEKCKKYLEYLNKNMCLNI